MFDITNRQKVSSFYLAILQMEATGHFLKNAVQSQTIFTYSQNSFSSAGMYSQRKRLKLHITFFFDILSFKQVTPYE